MSSDKSGRDRHGHDPPVGPVAPRGYRLQNRSRAMASGKKAMRANGHQPDSQFHLWRSPDYGSFAYWVPTLRRAKPSVELIAHLISSLDLMMERRAGPQAGCGCMIEVQVIYRHRNTGLHGRDIGDTADQMLDPESLRQ
jgi:hypothetical protein